MKKTTTIFLLISLICVAFAGCEQGKAPADDTVKETTQETPTEAPESTPEETADEFDFVDDVVYDYAKGEAEMLEKWNYVLKEKKITVKNIELFSYVCPKNEYPFTIKNSIEVGEEDTLALLDAIDDANPQFHNCTYYYDRWGDICDAHEGDEVIAVLLVDENKDVIFGFMIYPDGMGETIELTDWDRDNHRFGALRFMFDTKGLYEKIDEIYTRVFPERGQKESDTE